MTRCTAGGIERAPGGAEPATGESAWLQRRKRPELVTRCRERETPSGTRAERTDPVRGCRELITRCMERATGTPVARRQDPLQWQRVPR